MCTEALTLHSSANLPPPTDTLKLIAMIMLHLSQAYKANVICPNKHQADPEKFYNNHLLESETYIGGHVECLESGVFRSDLSTSFKLDSSAFEVSYLLTKHDFAVPLIL